MFELSLFWKLIIGIVLFSIVLNYFLMKVMDYRMIKKIEKNEKVLENCGVKPSGSTLTHGMCINSNGDLVGTESKNLNWYKRII